MKKLTKRNRTHNRKIVSGYVTECDPGDVPDYTTVQREDEDGYLYTTCTGAKGSCCDRDLSS